MVLIVCFIDFVYCFGVNYLIVCDGFLVFNNVMVIVININIDFDYVDYNLVKLIFIFK